MSEFPYETRLNVLHGPLEVVDVQQLADECTQVRAPHSRVRANRHPDGGNSRDRSDWRLISQVAMRHADRQDLYAVGQFDEEFGVSIKVMNTSRIASGEA